MPPIQAVTATISLIIAPVVLITACVLTVNGLMGRYGAIADRLRAVNREVQRWRQRQRQDSSLAERLAELESLLSDLLWRHHCIHDAILLVHLAIVTFMLDMLVIAIAVATDIHWLAQMVLIVFLAGVALLFFGMVLATYELRSSHHSIQQEVHYNCRSCRSRSRQTSFTR